MESSRTEQFGKELAEAYKEIATIRWRQDFICNSCSFSEYFEGKYPYSRRCANCKKDNSPTAGTIFHGVRFPLHVALYMIKRVAATEDRLTSEELTEELSTTFKLKMRQKTVWSFLMKVYSAIVFPIPEFTTYVNINKFNHGDKAIISIRGFVHGKWKLIAFAKDKNDMGILNDVIEKYTKSEVRLENTAHNGLTYVIAGKSPCHYQAYLNYFCFQANGGTYDQLMSMIM